MQECCQGSGCSKTPSIQCRNDQAASHGCWKEDRRSSWKEDRRKEEEGRRRKEEEQGRKEHTGYWLTRVRNSDLDQDCNQCQKTSAT